MAREIVTQIPASEFAKSATLEIRYTLAMNVTLPLSEMFQTGGDNAGGGGSTGGSKDPLQGGTVSLTSVVTYCPQRTCSAKLDKPYHN
jgi:hypothetical protein